MVIEKNIEQLTQGAYIGLTARSEFVSEKIRAVTGSDVSHVFVGYSPSEITEALGNNGSKGVVKNSLEDLLSDSKVTDMYIAVPRAFVPVQSSRRWQDERVGRPYDYPNTLVLQILYRIVRRLPFQRTDAQAEKRYQCAEYGTHWCKTYIPYSVFEPISAYDPEKVKLILIQHFDLYKRKSGRTFVRVN